MELRRAVRAVAEDRIAPYAAEVDENSSFPKVAYDVLRAADFHAPHLPEQYDGVGADALATCIVLEEVARVRASGSLAKITQIYEGANQIQRVVMARELLKL